MLEYIRFISEVEKQLQEGVCGTPQMSIKKGVGLVSERVQMRRPTNRRGKQAPTPPKRTRWDVI